MTSENTSTKWAQFIPLVSVFFFWGFVAASNDILIPVFQKAFKLSDAEGQLVSFAFYIAYTVGAILYMLISWLIKQDLTNKLGYKNGLALGLSISAIGTMLFYPAANNGSFALMLAGLFIVGLGFSLQQTVANPLAIALGSLNTGSQRLTLAGGINNLGTTIGPLIVSYAIFGAVSNENTTANIESVKTPYLILGAAFLAVAIFLKFSSLPDRPTIAETPEQDALGESTASLNAKENVNERKTALHYPQLVLGMIAIFVYVGVEVSTASNLPAYMEKVLGFTTKGVAPYVSLYWASLMIGRWTGAVEAFNPSAGATKFFKFLAPYFAFTVFLLVNYIMGTKLTPFYIYALIILVLIAADMASKGNPAKMLLIFSFLGITALLIGMFSSGLVSVYALISVGLFCSTLWPCIFTLAVSGLGNETAQGSNFLIMMIMGGGVISLLQGFVAQHSSYQFGYIVGVACFAYLAFYSWKVSSILKSQGISFDKKLGGGH